MRGTTHARRARGVLPAVGARLRWVLLLGVGPRLQGHLRRQVWCAPTTKRASHNVHARRYTAYSTAGRPRSSSERYRAACAGLLQATRAYPQFAPAERRTERSACRCAADFPWSAHFRGGQRGAGSRGMGGQSCCAAPPVLSCCAVLLRCLPRPQWRNPTHPPPLACLTLLLHCCSDRRLWRLRWQEPG